MEAHNLLLLLIIAFLLMIFYIEKEYKNIKNSEAFTLDVATANRLKAFSSLYDNGTLKVTDLVLSGDLDANMIESNGTCKINNSLKSKSSAVTNLTTNVVTKNVIAKNNAILDKETNVNGNKSHDGDMHVQGGSIYITKPGGDSRFTVANEKSFIQNYGDLNGSNVRRFYTVRYAGCSDYAPTSGVQGSINLAIKGDNVLKDVYLVEGLFGDRNCTFNGIKGF